MKLQWILKNDWPTLPFFFNLTGPVGRGYGHSSVDDVGLLQFCFMAIAVNLNQPAPADLKAVWSKVKLTGVMDDDTQASIDAWQGDRRKRFGAMFETDGIFSIAPPQVTEYGRNTPYSIVSINYILLFATASIWPRIDKHPLMTPILAAAVRKALSAELTA